MQLVHNELKPKMNDLAAINSSSKEILAQINLEIESYKEDNKKLKAYLDKFEKNDNEIPKLIVCRSAVEIPNKIDIPVHYKLAEQVKETNDKADRVIRLNQELIQQYRDLNKLLDQIIESQKKTNEPNTIQQNRTQKDTTNDFPSKE